MPQVSMQSKAELPAQWDGGIDSKGAVNTQLIRYEPQQRKPQHIPQWTPFSIPTANDSLSSGFPYTSRLRDMRVTPDQWLQFTTEVLKAAKLTFSEDVAAWTTGVTTGTLSTSILLVFGPVVGYYAGKSVHRKTVAKKVKNKLAIEGLLRNTLKSWNEGVFAEMGIQLWLEAPSSVGDEGVIVDVPEDAKKEVVKKERKKMARRFRFLCMPFDPRNRPLGYDYSAVSPQSMSPVSPQNQHLTTWSTNQRMDGDAKMGYISNELVEVDGVRPTVELGGDAKVKRKPVPVETFELDGGCVPARPPIPPKKE